MRIEPVIVFVPLQSDAESRRRTGACSSGAVVTGPPPPPSPPIDALEPSGEVLEEVAVDVDPGALAAPADSPGSERSSSALRDRRTDGDLAGAAGVPLGDEIAETD